MAKKAVLYLTSLLSGIFTYLLLSPHAKFSIKNQYLVSVYMTTFVKVCGVTVFLHIAVYFYLQYSIHPSNQPLCTTQPTVHI